MKIECDKIHPASLNSKKKKIKGGDGEEMNEEGNRILYIGSIGLMVGQIGTIIYWLIKS